MEFNHRDLEFLYELGTLKNMSRGWQQHLPNVKLASTAEHTMRVAFLALILARREGIKNEEKILKMALAHDLAETRTSDHSYIEKVYVEEKETEAIHDQYAGTSLLDFETDILKEYKARQSPESKIVKDADNLDIDLELREIAEQGSLLPAKWQTTRKMVRDQKLYTQSAKDLWDELDKVDVSDWHLTANKWYKQPNAGK